MVEAEVEASGHKTLEPRPNWDQDITLVLWWRESPFLRCSHDIPSSERVKDGQGAWNVTNKTCLYGVHRGQTRCSVMLLLIQSTSVIQHGNGLYPQKTIKVTQ
jgi:hypothetical protein